MKQRDGIVVLVSLIAIVISVMLILDGPAS